MTEEHQIVDIYPNLLFYLTIFQSQLVPPNLASGDKYKRLEHEFDRLIRRTKMSVSSGTTILSITRAASTVFFCNQNVGTFRVKNCKLMASKWLPSSFRKPDSFALHERNSSFFMKKVISLVKKIWRPTILVLRKLVASLIAKPPS